VAFAIEIASASVWNFPTARTGPKIYEYKLTIRLPNEALRIYLFPDLFADGSEIKY
jgi:hypothetical protein